MIVGSYLKIYIILNLNVYIECKIKYLKFFFREKFFLVLGFIWD